jgi:hypothetical protein
MSHGPLGLPRRGYSPGTLDSRHATGALDPRHSTGALDPRHVPGSDALVEKMQNIADYVFGSSNSKVRFLIKNKCVLQLVSKLID